MLSRMQKDLSPASQDYLSSLLTASASLIFVLHLPLPALASGSLAAAFLAFAAGALLADTALHLLPHAYAHAPVSAGPAVLAGVAAFAALDRAVTALSGHAHHAHAHAHHVHVRNGAAALAARKKDDGDGEAERRRRRRRRRRQAARGRAASAESSSSESRTVAAGGGAGGVSARAASAAWMNLAADGVHDFCDGLAVVAAYGVLPAAVVAQQLGDYMMLVRGRFNRGGAIAANFACGLAALLRTAVSLRVGEGFGKVLLPFCAGGLLVMAIGVVLPEMFEAVSDCGREGGVVRAVVAAVYGVAGDMAVQDIEAAAHELGGHAH